MPLELNVLETSFALIAPRGEELMDILYARLLRPLQRSSQCSTVPTRPGSTRRPEAEDRP
jgi:hypothetical protein